MKQTRFSAPILFLAICILLIASTSQSVYARDNNSSSGNGAIFATSAADGGRLFIKRSPLLGFNVAISIRIDGAVAGTLVWGRTYDRYITPGRHTVTLYPTGTGSPCRLMLDVRPGQTYSYSASNNVNTLVLTPVSAPR